MRASLLVALLCAGCDPGCSPAPAHRDAPGPAATRMISPRCAEEARAASVVLPPGTGEVDSLSVACDGERLGAFILRGHVLSWTSRRTATRAPFSEPVVIATGADRLGPVAVDAPYGPVAWRSPTAGLDAERDDVWAGLVHELDGGASSVRGDALLPAGAVGLGVPFAQRTPRGARVLATLARQGVAPATLDIALTLGRDEPTEVTDLSGAQPGQVEAWDAASKITLARVDEDGASYLEARRDGAAIGRHRLRAPEALLVPRGERTEQGSVFAVGEFAVGRGDAGSCVGQPGGLCVRPGRVLLLLVPPRGAIREIEVAPRGVPDAIAYDGRAVTVLYVEPVTDESTAQRAARVDLSRGGRESLDLAPPQGFPSIDTPRLARCRGELWLVSAISMPRGDAPRLAVTALPLACMMR